MLSGKKTYITGGLLALYNIAKPFLPEEVRDVVNEEFVNQIGLLAMLAFMRMGVKTGD